MLQVANLGLVHPSFNPVTVMILSQDIKNLSLRAAIERLVVPEGVIGVERDYIEHIFTLVGWRVKQCIPPAAPGATAQQNSSGIRREYGTDGMNGTNRKGPCFSLLFSVCSVHSVCSV